MRSRLRKLPETAGGDAAGAAVAGIVFTAIFSVLNLVVPWGGAGAGQDVFTGVVFSLAMFGWFRWTHHQKRERIG